jgi:hypothetical protein
LTNKKKYDIINTSRKTKKHTKERLVSQMNTTKLTQKDYFNMLIALANDNNRKDLVEFCQGRIALLDKKSSNKKPTKKQGENNDLKVVIEDVLGTLGKGVTVSELIKADERLADLSNQKVSAILKQMVDTDKTVVKTIEKKVSYFSLAECDECSVQ